MNNVDHILISTVKMKSSPYKTAINNVIDLLIDSTEIMCTPIWKSEQTLVASLFDKIGHIFA